MNYYGVSLTDDSEEFFDSILRPALMRVGEDDILPLRGPREFVNDAFTYKFEVTGEINNFEGVERIYRNNELVFQVKVNGGVIE